MVTEKNFIVFEGIDGSGKGTQIEMLKKYVADNKKNNIVFTFEPTKQGEWSQKIDDVLSGKIKDISNEQRQLLFILDRKDHIDKVIAPAIKKGMQVFCDRYFLSTLAYGSFRGETHWKTFWDNHKEIIGDKFIMPSKIIFFDIDSELAMTRIEKRNDAKSIFETLSNLKSIREKFLSIGSHFEGFTIIDGSGTPEEVFEKTKLALFEYL
ncbi:MAG: dTMP kinase [Candidatus Paceibacterota bacterium]|jgi:dTMP kinase